jgi:hypothetical protein
MGDDVDPMVNVMKVSKRFRLVLIRTCFPNTTPVFDPFAMSVLNPFLTDVIPLSVCLSSSPPGQRWH